MNRKKIDDRISLQYAANADVQQALIEWVGYIKNETLAIDFIAVPQLAVPPAIEIKIVGNKIHIDFKVKSQSQLFQKR